MHGCRHDNFSIARSLFADASGCTRGRNGVPDLSTTAVDAISGRIFDIVFTVNVSQIWKGIEYRLVSLQNGLY